MNSKTLSGVGIVLSILILGVYFAAQQAARRFTLNGSVIEPALAAADFELTQANGEVFRLSGQRGKVVLIFFGYTNCPDFCPTTLSEFKLIHQELDDLSAQVEFVFITIDPERDSAEKMQSYAQAFHPDFIGLSGDQETLQPIWEAFFVYRQKAEVGSAAGYLMEHSTRVIVVDKIGNFRMTFPYGLAANAMAADLIHLLNE